MAPSQFPFGFSSGDPGRGGSQGGIPDDLASKVPLFAELQKLLSSSGPVNWELARQMSIAAASAAPDSVGAGEVAEVSEAMRLADLWLDPVTTLPTGITTSEAWTAVQWIEKTLPTWQTLCDPVATRVVAAMQSGLPEEAKAAAGPLLGVLGTVGGLMFGAQVGQAVGTLALEVLGSTDIGFPLGPVGSAALIPGNVTAFGAGLEVDAGETRLYLALREAAHHRLYGHVPWLRSHVLGAVEAYARGIEVDSDAIGRAMAEIDPNDPESLQRAMGGGLFEQQTTPEQQAALNRLEVALAVVEGWVDAVVSAAAADRLPSEHALAETLRRRRATGGPAEQTFATLVGLELRPRRMREAGVLWRRLDEAYGAARRDAVWQHPDLMPGADDLDDPDSFVARLGESSDSDLDGLA
jgi:putative hydrolase